jgi:hypothetical protein
MAIPDRSRIKEALLEFISLKGGVNKAVTPQNAYRGLAEMFQLTKEDLELERDWERLWPNEVRWARQELVSEGLLLPREESGYGTWQLTGNRRTPDLSPVQQESRTPKTELELLYSDLADEGVFDPRSLSDAREIQLRAIVLRRGQQAFRELLLREYGRKCAITGETCVATLEAAHIVPYKGAETNRVENGLLLRSDVHILFDLYLVSVNESYEVSIAPSLISTGYRNLQGTSLVLPTNACCHPSKIALGQHRSHCDF